MVRYTSLEDAVAILRSCGPGALMAKADIQSAFRLLPIYPDDFCLLGICFGGGYYFDRALSMGCSVFFAFEKFSSFLEWLVRWKSGLPSTTHYLDDLLLWGR